MRFIFHIAILLAALQGAVVNERVGELAPAEVARVQAVIQDGDSLVALGEVIGGCDHLVFSRPLFDQIIEMIRLNRQAIFANVLPRLRFAYEDRGDFRLTDFLRTALYLRHLPIAGQVLGQQFTVGWRFGIWVPHPEWPLRDQPIVHSSLEQLRQFIYEHRDRVFDLSPNVHDMRYARDVPEAILMLEIASYCAELSGGRPRLAKLFVEGLGRNGALGDAQMSEIVCHAVNNGIVSVAEVRQILVNMNPLPRATIQMVLNWNEDDPKDPGCE
jgi:hypothetical protein